MTNNNDKPKGPIPVHGNITPISQTEIPEIDSSQWMSMSIESLFEQRNALISRMQAAIASGHAELTKPIEQGIQMIDDILKRKDIGGDKLL